MSPNWMLLDRGVSVKKEKEKKYTKIHLISLKGYGV
jgi:hypothetical protein